MHAATYLTIWVALTLFVLGEIGRALEGVRSPLQPLHRWARMLSATGLALAVVHTLLAFDVFHHWSHEAAVLATARQTDAVFGVRAGAGVYVNYVFFLAWLADLLTWPRVVPPTSRIWVLRAFYALIIVNAAVVFASGWRAVLGAACLGGLVYAWTLHLTADWNYVRVRK